MRDWLKSVCHLVFGTAGTVARVVNLVASAVHEVPFGTINSALEKGDEIVCTAVDGLFDAVKGVKDVTPE